MTFNGFWDLLVTLMVVKLSSHQSAGLYSPSLKLKMQCSRVVLTKGLPLSDRDEMKAFSYRSVLDEVLRRVEARLGNLEEYPIPTELQATTSEPRRGVAMRTSTVGYKVGPLRQLRAALIEPQLASDENQCNESLTINAELPLFPKVLNLVAFPDPSLRIPVFGADLVTLPNGHLVAIDLHPMLPPDDHHSEVILRGVKNVYDQYQVRPDASLSQSPRSLSSFCDSSGILPLPWGGDLPDEALPFFSPCAVWTRLPLNDAGQATLEGPICGQGVLDDGILFEYLNIFLDIAADAWALRQKGKEISAKRTYADAQKAYSQYRAEKDPARAMLIRMHGEEWTEQLIKEVLFDFR